MAHRPPSPLDESATSQMSPSRPFRFKLFEPSDASPPTNPLRQRAPPTVHSCPFSTVSLLSLLVYAEDHAAAAGLRRCAWVCGHLPSVACISSTHNPSTCRSSDRVFAALSLARRRPARKPPQCYSALCHERDASTGRAAANLRDPRSRAAQELYTPGQVGTRRSNRRRRSQLDDA